MFFYQAVLTAGELTAIRNREAVARTEVRIRTIEVIPGAITFTWKSAAGQIFHIDYTERLGQAWTTVSPSFLADVPTTAFTDNDATRLLKPTGFYRVVREQ